MTEAFCKKYPELCVKDYFTDTFLKIPQYGKKAKVPTEKKVRVDDDRVEPPEPVPESGIKVPQRTFDDILIPERRKVIDRTKIKHPHKGKGVDIARSVISGAKKQYKLTDPLYVKEIPEELSDIALAIEDPEKFVNLNREWDLLDNNQFLGHNILLNDNTKDIWVNFHGFDGRENWSENVFKHIPMNKLDKLKNSEDFIKNDELLTELEKQAKARGYKITYNGHSYGGAKAKYFGTKFNRDQNLFNAHIFPWNNFGKTKAKSVYHTTITDPTDFKHFLPKPIPDNETHFYYPGNVEPEVKDTFGRMLDGHYISSFNKEEKTLSNFSRYMNNIGFLGTLGMGLSAVSTAQQVKQKEDPTRDISQASAGFTDFGMVGLNPDPDYQWSDEKPPQFGFDWLLYKSVQPLKNAFMTKERRKEEEEIKTQQRLKERTERVQGIVDRINEAKAKQQEPYTGKYREEVIGKDKPRREQFEERPARVEVQPGSLLGD